MKHHGIPGPGGSLGQCAVCGKTFVVEILLARGVESFTVKGIDGMLYCHDACKKALVACGDEWEMLPEGPLRKCFEEASRPTLAPVVKG